MSEDLRPLSCSPEVGELVRDHFRDASDHPIVEYDVEAGLSRHHELLAAGAALPDWASGSSATAPSGTTVAFVAKLALGFLVVGGVGAGLVITSQSEPRPAPPSSPVSVVAAKKSEAKPSAPVAAPVDPPVAAPEPPVPTPLPAATRPATQRRRATSANPGPPALSGLSTTAPADDAVRQEIAAMGRARRLLVSNPAAALKLLHRTEKEYPSGFFKEEREALVVLALARVGQTDRAHKRGEAFLAQYPTGSFNRRVRRTLKALVETGRGLASLDPDER